MSFQDARSATRLCGPASSGSENSCLRTKCGELKIISIADLATSGLSSEPLRILDISSIGRCEPAPNTFVVNLSKSIRRKRRSRDSQPDWCASRLQLLCHALWVKSLIYRTSGERKRCEDASHSKALRSKSSSDASVISRSFWSACASPRRFGSLEVYSGADRAQITLGRSHDCCFCICEHVGFPPTAVDLLE